MSKFLASGEVVVTHHPILPPPPVGKTLLSVNGKKEELLKRLTEAIREIHSESTDSNKLNEPDTTLNKENLTNLIKEILKEEFSK